MKKYLPFYSALIVTLLLLPVLYLLTCQVFLKLSLKKGDLWMHPFRVVKRYIGETAPPGKIVIMSGSNGMFFDGFGLQKELNRPVANLAIFGGLPIQFYPCELKTVVRKGDIVVLPFEFEYYTAPGISDHGLYILYEWADDYYDTLSRREKTELFLRDSSEWFLRHISKLLVFRVRPRRLDSPEHIIGEWRKHHPAESWIDEGPQARYIDLDETGSLRKIGQQIPGSRFSVHGPYPDHITPYFLKYYKQIVDEVRSAGALPVVTWPSICPGKTTDAAEFAALLARHGIVIYGEPAVFAADDFYDTGYHLNIAGARKRTPYLAAAIRQALSDAEKAGTFGKTGNR